MRTAKTIFLTWKFEEILGSLFLLSMHSIHNLMNWVWVRKIVFLSQCKMHYDREAPRSVRDAVPLHTLAACHNTELLHESIFLQSEFIGTSVRHVHEHLYFFIYLVIKPFKSIDQCANVNKKESATSTAEAVITCDKLCRQPARHTCLAGCIPELRIITGVVKLRNYLKFNCVSAEQVCVCA